MTSHNAFISLVTYNIFNNIFSIFGAYLCTGFDRKHNIAILQYMVTDVPVRKKE